MVLFVYHLCLTGTSWRTHPSAAAHTVACWLACQNAPPYRTACHLFCNSVVHTLFDVKVPTTHKLRFRHGQALSSRRTAGVEAWVEIALSHKHPPAKPIIATHQGGCLSQMSARVGRHRSANTWTRQTQVSSVNWTTTTQKLNDKNPNKMISSSPLCVCLQQQQPGCEQLTVNTAMETGTSCQPTSTAPFRTALFKFSRCPN